MAKYMALPLLLLLLLAPAAPAFVEPTASWEPPAEVAAPAPGAIYDQGGTEEPEARLVIAQPEEISLAANRVSVVLRDQVAVVRVTHLFQNNTGRILQARYVMPLGSGAHVTGYAIWEKGQRLEGELMDVRRAEDLYREVTRQEITAQPEVAQEPRAVRVARDPGLLRQTSADRFETHIYPIEPYALKQMEISYSQKVEAQDGWCSWSFPLEAAAVFRTAPAEIRFDMELADSSGLAEVACEFPGAKIERHPDGGATIRVLARGHRPAAPLTLRWRTGLRPLQPAALYHRRVGEAAYALMRVGLPGSATAGSGLFTVFAADMSRSLQGPKGERQARILDGLASTLLSQDRSCYLGFSERPGPAAGSWAEARPQVPPARSTRLILALREAFALALEAPEGLQPVVVLLSDGVSCEDPDEVLAAVPPGPARLLAIATGYDDDTDLLSRLAERHGGWLWIPGHGERRERWSPLAADILEQPYGQASRGRAGATGPAQILDHFRAPAVTGLRLETEAATLDVHPAVHPPVPPGGTATFLLRLDHPGPTRLRLHGQVGRQAIDLPVDLDPPTAEPAHGFVASFWARGRAEELLLLHPHGDADPQRARIVELSLEHRFVTPYTAFLSLPDHERRRLLLGPAPQGDEALYRFAAAAPEAGFWALLALGAITLFLLARGRQGAGTAA